MHSLFFFLFAFFRHFFFFISSRRPSTQSRDTFLLADILENKQKSSALLNLNIFKKIFISSQRVLSYWLTSWETKVVCFYEFKYLNFQPTTNKNAPSLPGFLMKYSLTLRNIISGVSRHKNFLQQKKFSENLSF